MNNKYFRVIFSKVLNCLVVVSELAKSEGKNNKKCGAFLLPFSQFLGKLKPISFRFFCALGFVTFANHTLAETLIIQADKAASKNQQPIILHTANGLPQVNIQTPNAQGLSHNKYTKFDVDTKGAILNNSASNVKTQQAGWIQANPYLAKGEAKVILNEVNSHDPSVLKGYIEVAGKKADVIIANPSGLHCDGCGIINAHRATFTTGQAQINNGHLEGFVVEKGRVTVSGKGLDNSKVDYTEILAREVQANAGIWSKKDLKVATGKNHIKRTSAEENLQILHTQEENSAENAPHFAIDVGELGGMYAGKIHLIGTENGVGVRNAGHIGASAETLKIDSQGRIVNTGILNSNKGLDLTATKGIENKGKIENRQENIKLTSQQDIKQDGSIVARQGNIHKQAAKAITQQGESVAKGDIRYTAASVNASTRSLIAAGVNVKDSNKGEIRELDTQSAQGDSIQITTANKATLQGKNIASGKVQVQANEVNLDNSQNSAHLIQIKAVQGNIQANSALFTAQNHIQLTTPQALSTQASHLTAKVISTTQQSLNAKNSVWQQTGTKDLHLKGNSINTEGAVFSTQGNLLVEGQQLYNEGGTLSTKKSLILNLSEGIDSTRGQLIANENLNITSVSFNNDSGLIYAKQNAKLNSIENITNRKGKIHVGREFDLVTKNLEQVSGLINAKILNLVSTQVNSTQNSEISANNISLKVDTLNNNSSSLVAQQNMTIDATEGIQNNQGIIAAQNADLHLHTGKIDNQQGRIISLGNILLNAVSNLLNQDGKLYASNNLSGIIQNSVNNIRGIIQSGDQLDLVATNIDNQAGKISAKAGVITADNLNNCTQP